METYKENCQNENNKKLTINKNKIKFILSKQKKLP